MQPLRFPSSLIASLRRAFRTRSRPFLAEEDGFSLSELMVVLIIVGILSLLALPRFMSMTTRAKMTEAKLMLRQVSTLQEAYYLEHDVYSPSLRAIGFEQTTLVTEEGRARYQVSIEAADGLGFVGLATSVVDYDKDGTLNVWEVREDGRITERVPD